VSRDDTGTGGAAGPHLPLTGSNKGLYTCDAVGRESWLLTRLGVPSSIANLAMGTQLAIGLIVAPLGEDAIAGAGIGVMWQNVTAISVFVGIQFGFGALCAQSYGSKNYRRVGVLLQRTLLIQAVLCIPMAALWYWTEAILLSLGQPATVSRYAGIFVRTQLIALPFQGLYQAVATFLRKFKYQPILDLNMLSQRACLDSLNDSGWIRYRSQRKVHAMQVPRCWFGCQCF
jgi:uncharacterized membrane protein